MRATNGMTETQLRIVALHDDGLKTSEICKVLSVAKSYVRKIVRRERGPQRPLNRKTEARPTNATYCPETTAFRRKLKASNEIYLKALRRSGQRF